MKSKNNDPDFSFLIDALVENILVNLIVSQGILKLSVELRKPSKEDLFSTTPQVKMLTAGLSAVLSVT